MNRFAFITGAFCALLIHAANVQGCDLPYELIGSKCLYVDPMESGSYYDMRLFCSRQGPAGGTLVRISSASQLSDIINYITDFGLIHSNYWVDATDEGHEGIWMWGDATSVPMGSPFWRYDCDASFTQRPATDPMSNCAVLDKESHYLFADVSCLGDVGALPYSPICESK